MKIKVDEKEILNLNDVKLKVIANDIPSEILNDDCCRRICHVIMHKYEQCFKRLKEEWEPKLKSSGVKSIPLDEDEFAQMVFAHPEYQNRSTREAKVQ